MILVEFRRRGGGRVMVALDHVVALEDTTVGGAPSAGIAIKLSGGHDVPVAHQMGEVAKALHGAWTAARNR